MLPARRFHDNWLPDVFNDFFNDNAWLGRPTAAAPAVNVLENEKNYEVEVAAPGMTKDDFKVSLDENGDLVINLEKKNKEEKKSGHWLRHEFSYEKFQQTLLLPDNVDREKIGAKVEDGVLKIDLPKFEEVKPDDKRRSIEIQ